jgi:DNA-binding transcriptional LysR family regulator
MDAGPFVICSVSVQFEQQIFAQRMSDRFQEMNVFVRTAETGSFSAAARELGLSQPSVSRIVSELEKRLEIKLLLRSTRKIVPTEAGVAFLQRARQVLFDLEEADEAARGMDSLRGMLRVALPSVLAVRVVIPRLPEFMALHPLLKIELLTSDLMHDLVAAGADMAIRFGRLEDSAFGAKKLAVEPRLLVASPAYLQAYGTPQSPSDLIKHDCIAGPGGSANLNWRLLRDGQATTVKIEPRIQVTAAEALLASARAGLGITIASSWICGAELKTGELVRLLPHYTLEPVDVHAVFPAGREPSQKIRLFTAFLQQILADIDAKYRSIL